MISGIPIDISSSPAKRNECTYFGLQGNQQIDDLVISQGSWLPSLEWFHLQKCIPKESTSNPSEWCGCCSRPERHFSKGSIGDQITSRTINVRIYKYHLYSNICLWNCKSSLFFPLKNVFNQLFFHQDFGRWKRSAYGCSKPLFKRSCKHLICVPNNTAMYMCKVIYLNMYIYTCTYTLCSHPKESII